MSDEHRDRHRRQREEREPRVDDEHRDDERKREEDGVPRLDGELAHADAEHLDVADDARHLVADGGPVQIGDRPRERPAQRIGAQVGADAGVGGHQPPALEHARPLGKQRAADQQQRGERHVLRRRLAPLERERLVDRIAEEDGRQDHGRVHDDAGERAEDELARDLAEVTAQLPEIRHARAIETMLVVAYDK